LGDRLIRSVDIKKKGKRIPPWGTPAKIFLILDTEEPNRI